MTYKFPEIADLAVALNTLFEDSADKQIVLKDKRLGELLRSIKDKAPEDRGAFGGELNSLKQTLLDKVNTWQAEQNAPTKTPIDITAPFAAGSSAPPSLFPARSGAVHPLSTEAARVVDIFARMGFTAVESRLLDDAYHMFDSLNFPKDHPARDEYDTFLLDEKDSDGNPLVAPAHVSVMQNRILKEGKQRLEEDCEPIAAVYMGRTFRNEDVDARHEHTFDQVEIIYVSRDVNAGNLIATFKTFLEEYYGKQIEVKMQPFYFPFTEPSFEMALSCPFCDKAGCNICGEGWIELLGCGLVNPNVLRMAGLDPEVYTGFAGGMGFDRLVMMKYDIEDVRHFRSGKLDFVRQFA